MRKYLTKHKQTALNDLMMQRSTMESPQGRGTPSLLPGVFGLTCLGVLARLMLSAARSSWPSGGRQATAEDVLASIVAWSGLAVCLWLASTFLLVTLSALPGFVGRWAARVAQAITPMFLRRALSLVVGASVGTLGLPTDAALGGAQPPGLTLLHAIGPQSPSPAFGPTEASTSPSPAFRATPSWSWPPTPAPVPGAASTAAPMTSADRDVRSRGSLSPGWRPSRPTTVHDAESSQLLAPVPRTTAAPVETVTVRRGDSLWSIAGRHLGPDATDAEIAVAWPAWYALNADLVGDDPDLIHPGLRLRVPTDGDQP